MTTVYMQTWVTPLGILYLYATDLVLLQISFRSTQQYDCIEEENPVLVETKHQLKEYFAGKRRTFNIPIHIEGNAFTQRVLNQLQAIPYGATSTYKDMACRCHSPHAYRAVGYACNKNRLPIIIPCHRVINSSGKLGGFAGGTQWKNFLLEIERNNRIISN